MSNYVYVIFRNVFYLYGRGVTDPASQFLNSPRITYSFGVTTFVIGLATIIPTALINRTGPYAPHLSVLSTI